MVKDEIMLSLENYLNSNECSEKKYIKECIQNCIYNPSLVYIPCQDAARKMTIQIAKCFIKNKSSNIKLFITVEDRVYEKYYKTMYDNFSENIGNISNLSLKSEENIYIISYSILTKLQKEMEIDGFCGIVFDDIKNISRFLDISRKYEKIIKSMSMVVGITTSPFMFYDYFSLEDKYKSLGCYTPVRYTNETSYYFKKIIGTSEIIDYERWDDLMITENDMVKRLPNTSINETFMKLYNLITKTSEEKVGFLMYLLKNDIYDFEYVKNLVYSEEEIDDELKEIADIPFISDKISTFLSILTNKISKRTFVVFKNEEVRLHVYNIILGKIEEWRDMESSENEFLNNMDYVIKGRLNNYRKSILNLIFVTDSGINFQKSDEIILFDYLPIYNTNTKYILSDKNMRDFIESLLKVENNIEKDIKPKINSTQDSLEEKVIIDTSMYKLYGGIKKIKQIRILQKEKSMLKRYLIKGDDVLINIISMKNTINTLRSVSRYLDLPISVKRNYETGKDAIFFINRIDFGIVNSYTEFSNAKTLNGVQYIIFRKDLIFLYSFDQKVCFKIEIDASELDDYIFFERDGRVSDVYFCLKMHPKVFMYQTRQNITKMLKSFNDMNFSDKTEFLDSWDWRRCSIEQAAFLQERYDIKINVNITHEKNILILREYFEEVNREQNFFNLSGDANKENKSMQKTSLNDFDPIECFYRILDRYKNTFVIVSNIKARRENGYLNCSYILKKLSKMDFDEYYYYACLFSSKEKYLTCQLEEHIVDKFFNFDAKSFCYYMYCKLRKRFLNLNRIIENFKCNKPPGSSALGSMEIRQAIITPLSIVFVFPTVNGSNRVLREFDSDKFLRVSLREETTKDKLKHSSGRIDDNIYNYFKNILSQGIFIGNRKYFFLAMSTSQMRQHNTWFVTPYFRHSVLVGPDYIRSWLGDFSQIKNIGKYVVRLGQALSTTEESIKVSDFKEIPDIERNGYVFTDGIGMISFSLAQEIAASIQLKEIPTAFQIRYAGFKGVIAVHPWLDKGNFKILPSYKNSCKSFCLEDSVSNCNLSEAKKILDFCKNSQMILRPSMKKFDSFHQSLDIVSYATSMPFHLNRQVIMILEALGVKEDVFISLQDQAIGNMMKEITKNFSSVLRKYSLVSLSNVISPDFAFYRKMILPILNRQNKDFITKSKIFIAKGRSLMGVVDELGILNEGEVFVMVKKEKLILDLSLKNTVNTS